MVIGFDSASVPGCQAAGIDKTVQSDFAMQPRPDYREHSCLLGGGQAYNLGQPRPYSSFKDHPLTPIEDSYLELPPACDAAA